MTWTGTATVRDGAGLTATRPVTIRTEAPPTAATRLGLWTSPKVLTSFVDPAELASWGFTDVVAGSNALPTIGGTPPGTWEQGLVERYHAAGLAIFRGHYLSRRDRPQQTMLVDWWDDTAWWYLLIGIHDVVVKARQRGYDGLALDEEDYFGTWALAAAGPQTDAAKRAQAFKRGHQLMNVIANAWPGVEIVDYHTYWPTSWNPWVQHKVNRAPYPVEWPASMQFDFWRGALDRGGHGDLHFWDATFYKTKHVAPPNPYPNTIEAAMRANQDWARAWWDRNLTAKADRSKLHVEAFVAISPIETGTTTYEDALTVTEARNLLEAGARTGPMVGVYHQGAWPKVTSAGTFDYGPHVPALRAVSGA